MVVADLFAAGMVTTSTTLNWALLLMILHPDVQREPAWGWEGGPGRKGRHILLELNWDTVTPSTGLTQPPQE